MPPLTWILVGKTVDEFSHCSLYLTKTASPFWPYMRGRRWCPFRLCCSVPGLNGATEPNCDLLISPFVQRDVGVGSLECASVVCMLTCSLWGRIFLIPVNDNVHEARAEGGTEQEMKARHKQSPCLIMTSITRILSASLSRFPIMSILPLGFATTLAVLDIHILSQDDMKTHTHTHTQCPNWTLSNTTAPAA